MIKTIVDLRKFVEEFADSMVGLDCCQVIMTFDPAIKVSTTLTDRQLERRDKEDATRDWKEFGEELIDKLDLNEYGKFQIGGYDNTHVWLNTKDKIVTWIEPD